MVGFDQLNRKLEAMGPVLKERAQVVLWRAAEMARTHMAKQYLTNGPIYVRTGRLRGSWRAVQASPEIVVLGTKVKYARVLNDGFRGPVRVKAHTRSKPKRRSTGRRRLSLKGRARARSEVRARSENRARLEKQSRAAHGMSLGKLKRVRLAQRRARGLQGGVEPAGASLLREAKRSGTIAVRAHGRYMKIRGHHYVERTIRDIEPRILRMVEIEVKKATKL